MIYPKGKREFERYVEASLRRAEDYDASAHIRLFVEHVRAQWIGLDREIVSLETELSASMKASIERGLP